MVLPYTVCSSKHYHRKGTNQELKCHLPTSKIETRKKYGNVKNPAPSIAYSLAVQSKLLLPATMDFSVAISRIVAFFWRRFVYPKEYAINGTCAASKLAADTFAKPWALDCCVA
jgi:hypothetical protein